MLPPTLILRTYEYVTYMAKGILQINVMGLEIEQLSWVIRGPSVITQVLKSGGPKEKKMVTI